MVSDTRRKAQARQTIISLALGCALLAVIGLSSESYYAGGAGLVIAVSAIFALIVWGILRAAVGGDPPSRIKPVHLLALFLAACVPGMAVLGYVKDQQRLAASSIRSATGQAMTPGAHIDTATTAAGAPGEIEKYVRKELAAFADEQARYAAELKATGVTQATTVPAMASPGGLEAAADALTKARAAIKAHRDRYDALFEQAKADVESVNGPIELKAQLYQGLETSAGQNLAASRQITDLDDRAFAEKAQEVQILRTAMGRWKAEGAKLFFADDDTLARYSQHAANIPAILAQEESIAEATKARVDKAMDQLSTVAK